MVLSKWRRADELKVLGTHYRLGHGRAWPRIRRNEGLDLVQLPCLALRWRLGL